MTTRCTISLSALIGHRNLTLSLIPKYSEIQRSISTTESCSESTFYLKYTERRFPAPQYSSTFPGHNIEQSEFGAGTEPCEKLFPQ